MGAFKSAWEASFYNPILEQGQIAEERTALLDAAIGMAERPPGESPELKAFALTIKDRLERPEKYEKFIDLADSLNQARQEIPAEHRIRLFQIAFQYILMQETRKGNTQYPINGQYKAQWHRWIDQVIEDPKLYSDLEDLWPNNNQTNIPKRYAGVRLAIAAYSDILPESLTLLDSGTAGFLGPIALEHNSISTDIQVITESAEERQLVLDGFKYKTNIKQSLGIDLIHPDPHWLDACLYPNEIRDASLLQEREAMFQKIRERVLLGDATDFESLSEVRKLLPGSQADLVSAITSNYEIPVEEQERARINQEAHARFLKVEQDTAEVQPDNSQKLVYAEDIYADDAHYRLFAKDMTSRGTPFVELGYWSDFRCDVFFPTPDLIKRLMYVRKLGLV